MSADSLIILAAIFVGAVIAMISTFALVMRARRRARRRRSLSWYYDWSRTPAIFWVDLVGI